MKRWWVMLLGIPGAIVLGDTVGDRGLFLWFANFIPIFLAGVLFQSYMGEESNLEPNKAIYNEGLIIGYQDGYQAGVTEGYDQALGDFCKCGVPEALKNLIIEQLDGAQPYFDKMQEQLNTKT